MRLIIDNEEVVHDFGERANLKSVVETVSEDIYNENRVIAGYEINGNHFEGKDSELADRIVSNTEELKILTNPLKDVITESLIGANSYLSKIKKGLENCSLLIQGDHVQEAMNLLQQCVTGLGGFMEIVDKGSQLIATTISPGALEDLPVIEKRVAINEVLNKIVDDLTKSDFISVSDLLEYELIPNLNEWMILLPQVIERVEYRLN